MRPQITQQFKTLESLCGAPFVQEMIGLFLTESETRLSLIESLLTEGKLMEIGQLFHKMQGSAASIDALRLRRLCALGEEACARGDIKQATRIFQLCLLEANRLRPAFLRWKPQ